MLADRVEAVCRRLREGGSRVTPQRLAIIAHVFESRAHPTAQEVFQALAVRYPTMSLATVYKTLHLLEELGEVALVAVEPGRARYDGARPSPHVHLYCEACGAIADAPGDAGEDVLHPVRGSGWRVSSWRLEVVGNCPSCSARPGAEQGDSAPAADRD